MSIKRNILANYIGQLYAALIGILLVPIYVRYLGLEAYGLVGLYTMLQGWFALLDMGLSPTLAREAARCNGGASSPLELRRLLRSFEGIFLVLGTSGALLFVAGAGWVANSWLNVQELEIGQVESALVLMAIVIVLRWLCGLYRGAIGGFERIIWLSGFNIVIATLRFVLVIPFLIHVGATPTHFFAFQLMVAAVELLWLIGKTYRVLPPLAVAGFVRWQWAPMRGVLRFALTSAFTSMVWVLVTQTDKLILSGILPLTEYAYFTLAVLVASGIIMLSSPIAGAILPRLTKLSAQGDEAGLICLYRDATQLMAVIAMPIVITLAFFPAQVLGAWTGKPELAANAAPVLTLYALGNGVLTLAAFPYYLQVARGDLNLHLVGNMLFVLLFVPLLLLAVTRFGMIGAGYAWVVANLLPFLVWLPIVHRRFLKGLHLAWLVRDIGLIVVPPTIVASVLLQVVNWPATRGWAIALLIAVYAALGLVAASCSSTVRARVRSLAIAGST